MYKEIFVPLIDYEGLYLISNFGNIKTLWKRSPRTKLNDYMLTPCMHTHGYLRFAITDNTGFKKTKYAHKLVFESFHGKINKPYEIDHIDGNKFNNRLNNLQKITHYENINKIRRNKIPRNFKKIQENILNDKTSSIQELADDNGILYITAYKIKNGLVNHNRGENLK